MADTFQIAYSGLTTIECSCFECTELNLKPPLVVTVPSGFGNPNDCYGQISKKQFILTVGMTIPNLRCRATIKSGSQTYIVAGMPAAFLNSEFNKRDTKIKKIAQSSVIVSG